MERSRRDFAALGLVMAVHAHNETPFLGPAGTRG